MTAPEALAAIEGTRLTPRKLAQLSGYSKETISWMLRGQAAPGGSTKLSARAIKPAVGKRFKLTCMGVDAVLKGKVFRW